MSAADDRVLAWAKEHAPNPNDLLRALRSMADEIIDNADPDVSETLDAGTSLAEVFRALDGWMVAGGTMPTDWALHR